MRDLDIFPAQVDKLAEMFNQYVTARHVRLADEPDMMRMIRHFLHDKKPEIRREFAGSVLGQSGCFVYSVKSLLLGERHGIKSSLARSTGTRALHVMLIDEHGEPYDIRELQKGGVQPLSNDQVRAYGQYLQPLVYAANQLRSAVQKDKRTAVHRSAPIIPCEEEMQTT